MKFDKNKTRRNAVIAMDTATVLVGKASHLAKNLPVTGAITQKITETVANKTLAKNRDGEHLSPLLEILRHARRLTSPPNKRTSDNLRHSYAHDMHSFRRYFKVGHVEDMMIPLKQNKVDLPARYYKPKVSAQQSVLPVLLVFFHGGGFVMGDLDTHDDACRLICQHAGMPVLSVDYRLAPEHPYPTAVHDTEETLAWLLAHKERFGADYISVGGDSAGANLSAVVAQSIASQLNTKQKTDKPSFLTRVTKRNKSKTESTNILAQLLIYPPTDASTQTESEKLYDDGYFLDKVDRDIFYDKYIQGNDDVVTNVNVSPVLNNDLTGLAPCLLVTAGFDILCDEGIAYAEHLQQHGIKTQTMHYGRLPHAFVNFASIHQESKTAVIEISKQWRKLCQELIKEQSV